MNENGIVDTYEWHFLERFPPRYLSAPRFISMFRAFIREAAEARNGFEDRLRLAALFAVASGQPELIRRGMQCLASVGRADDLPLLNSLVRHADENVARDAKTCSFEIAHGNAMN